MSLKINGNGSDGMEVRHARKVDKIEFLKRPLKKICGELK